MAPSPSSWWVAVDEESGWAVARRLAHERAERANLDVSLLDCSGHGGRTYPGRVVASRRGQQGEEWRRPGSARIRAIRDRLRELYGQPVNHPHGHPIAELVRTILSQNTSDTNRDRAYDRLRERFPLWEEVRDAPTAEVIEAIRPGGLANIKGPADPGGAARAAGPRRATNPRLARRRAARGGSRVPHLPARRRPQDRGLRDDLRPRAARDPRRHPRPPRRRTPRPLPARRLLRGRARRDDPARRPPRTPTSSTST